MAKAKSVYGSLAVDVHKEGIGAFKKAIDNVFPGAFCVAYQDPQLPGYVCIDHADGAGSKPVQNYLNWRVTGNLDCFRGMAQDTLAMNLDDIMCVGAVPKSFVDYVAINKNTVPKNEVLKILAEEFHDIFEMLRKYKIDINFAGGETADLPDQIRTLDVSGMITARANKYSFITSKKIRPRNTIVGLRSGGPASVYEKKENSGIMCNGITLARHCLMHPDLETQYPEIRDPNGKGYTGRLYPQSSHMKLGMSVGEAITSPTRIFAPVIKRIMDVCGKSMTGIVHNSGGGQTKYNVLGNGHRFVLNNLPEPDHIFNLIQHESNTPLREMWEDFNMGTGMGLVFSSKKAAKEAIKISKDEFNIGAQEIGHVEETQNKRGRNQVRIKSRFGTFTYTAKK